MLPKLSLLVCASLLLAVVLRGPTSVSALDGEAPPLPSPPQPDKVELDDTELKATNDEDELPVSTVPDTGDLLVDQANGQQQVDLNYMAEPRNKLDIFRLIQTGFKEHYEMQYDKINKYLVDKLKDNIDPDLNLALAKKWLEEEREEQSKAWLYTKQATIAALEQFLELDKVRDPEIRCTYTAYAILWRNNKATRGRAQKPPSELFQHGCSLRRIDAVYRQISLQHTVDCFPVYPYILSELLEKMDRNELRLVETYLDNVLGERDCIISDVRTLVTPKAIERAYDLIEKNSVHDPDQKYLTRTVDEVTGKLVVKDEGVQILAERYIIEPCRKYVNLLGPNIFIPVRFALKVFESSDRYGPANTPLLHSRLHYRLCKVVIGKERDAFIWNLTKFIKSKV